MDSKQNNDIDSYFGFASPGDNDVATLEPGCET